MAQTVIDLGKNKQNACVCVCVCVDWNIKCLPIESVYGTISHIKALLHSSGSNSNSNQNDDGYNFQSYDWNNWNNWKSVEGSGGGQYGGSNNQYEGRNGGNYYDNGEGENQEDYYANGEQENQDSTTVVVNQLDGTYNPYSAFDISQCDTYEHLWEYDLKISCANGDRFCDCTYAEELLYMGLLSCGESASCPDDCPVCSSCMRNICVGTPSKVIARAAESNATMAAMAFFGTVLFGVCVAFVQRKKSKGDLDENLMDTDNDTSSSSKVWMVPVNDDGLPTERSNTCKPVWLVPEIKSTEHVEDSIFPDLLEGTIDKEVKVKPKSNRKQGKAKASTRRQVSSNRREEGAGPIPVINIVENVSKQGKASTRKYVDSNRIESDEGNINNPIQIRPGIFLAPVSDEESVTSSISDSAASKSLKSSEGSSISERESMISDNRSIGTTEGEI